MKLVIGGSGFIGSVLVNRIMKDSNDIIVIDKLSLGSSKFIDTNKVEFHNIDINNIDDVLMVLDGRKIKEVWHLAANSDIPAGVENMDVDLNDTFMSTVSLLSLISFAIRSCGVIAPYP